MVYRFPRPFAAHLPRGGRHRQRLLQGTRALCCSAMHVACIRVQRGRRHTTHTSPLLTQVEPADTQAAIARLAETPVELAEVEEEVEDTRPLWDRPNDRWGQTETGGDSDIP